MLRQFKLPISGFDILQDLVSPAESAGRTSHFKQIYKNVYLGGLAEQTDLQIKTCFFGESLFNNIV